MYFNSAKSDTKVSDSIILQQSCNKEDVIWKVEALHAILISCPKIQCNNSQVSLLQNETQA